MTSQQLTIAVVLSFVTLMQLLSCWIAAFTRRPKLAVIGYCIVTGAAGACAMYPFMPSKDAAIISVFMGLVIAASCFHLTHKSMTP
ncbi:hypothetical protein [Pseudomonas cannabina]|nr:hypothetical protein [Pseudomonas cannabina]